MIIPQTIHTPLVVASPDSGVISIKGKIIPENPDEFFNQLEIITQRCIEEKNGNPLNINIQVDYFNTPSLKMLAKYFKSVIPVKPTINWHYEPGDDSIREAGEDYASLLNFPFNLVEL